MNKRNLIEEFLVSHQFIESAVARTLFKNLDFYFDYSQYKKHYMHFETKAVITVDYYNDLDLDHFATLVQFSNGHDWLHGDYSPVNSKSFNLADSNCFLKMEKWIDVLLTRRNSK